MAQTDEIEMYEQVEVGQRQFYFLAFRRENPRYRCNKSLNGFKAHTRENDIRKGLVFSCRSAEVSTQHHLSSFFKLKYPEWISVFSGHELEQ